MEFHFMQRELTTEYFSKRHFTCCGQNGEPKCNTYHNDHNKSTCVLICILKYETRYWSYSNASKFVSLLLRHTTVRESWLSFHCCRFDIQFVLFFGKGKYSCKKGGLEYVCLDQGIDVNMLTSNCPSVHTLGVAMINDFLSLKDSPPLLFSNVW